MSGLRSVQCAVGTLGNLLVVTVVPLAGQGGGGVKPAGRIGGDPGAAQALSIGD